MVAVVLVLMVVFAIVGWLGLEGSTAPMGCDRCQGLYDCPGCGPLTDRTP